MARDPPGTTALEMTLAKALAAALATELVTTAGCAGRNMPEVLQRTVKNISV